MEIRFQNSPKETSRMNTKELRENFHIPALMQDDQVQLVYSHYDRVIVGGVKPYSKAVELPNHTELRAEYFLERRELGIINVGGNGAVEADGEKFTLSKLDCLYLGKGVKKVSFTSDDKNAPAVFYLLSSPAHASYPTRKLTKEEASPTEMGDQTTANRRTIYKYIHADGIKSAQLVMGLTVLASGSVWNTMPAHVHTRRMEAYFYFDVPEQHRVFHFMGEPTETRHLLIANHEAVVSPPWSIHSGCGTSNYSFIWGMAGENYVYTDMDAVAIADIR
ncbi:5-dehydro-4-deoxy-D-glucuronate isomerase [Paraflavitalea soli]|uniref:4-deoxy-L-threo-5-hexosulose-uronate ketol-isomerase n=1 Tax=Paraflavitalea soli TaxID=2315862 RepID=A0A3B7MMA9_9BACT|nr:5-dehydro-4-deoxy-D-glucuronate isomerase [Paraflavitalea soli]AXY75644.1 5-dehydro-4-deoxy-D-glucuronate isomerase [Paraflavitalea soli]